MKKHLKIFWHTKILGEGEWANKRVSKRFYLLALPTTFSHSLAQSKRPVEWNFSKNLAPTPPPPPPKESLAPAPTHPPPKEKTFGSPSPSFNSHLNIFRRCRFWQSQGTSMQESSFCVSHAHHRSVQPERTFQRRQVNATRRSTPQWFNLQSFPSRSFLEENNFSPHRCDVITQQFEASVPLPRVSKTGASLLTKSLFQEHKEDVRILLSRFVHRYLFEQFIVSTLVLHVNLECVTCKLCCRVSFSPPHIVDASWTLNLQVKAIILLHVNSITKYWRVVCC